MKNTCQFFTLVKSPHQIQKVRLLIESIRTFGGHLKDCPIWVFSTDLLQDSLLGDALTGGGVKIQPLDIPRSVQSNYFASKVYACARAEQLAPSYVQSLIWLSSDCLVLNPPELFDLGAEFDVALRPVHIKNIGLSTDQPLDDFWTLVYQAVGVEDLDMVVESFVDIQRIRAYFNSHFLSINPKLNMCQTWFETFENLVCDREFQQRACQDDLHQIFLHQAVLSALIATRIEPERMHILPPTYSYPYNLQGEVPNERRAISLNTLVCIAYEDRSLNPVEISDICIDEPLESWLARHI